MRDKLFAAFAAVILAALPLGCGSSSTGPNTEFITPKSSPESYSVTLEYDQWEFEPEAVYNNTAPGANVTFSVALTTPGFLFEMEGELLGTWTAQATGEDLARWMNEDDTPMFIVSDDFRNLQIGSTRGIGYVLRIKVFKNGDLLGMVETSCETVHAGVAGAGTHAGQVSFAPDGTPTLMPGGGADCS